MKRCVRSINNQLYNKTNFNDWSDPKCPPIVNKSREITTKTNQDVEDEAEETPRSVSSQTSVEIEELRNKIKKGYALLTKKEIRNIKLPFYESLLLNLKEDGFTGSYEFIKDLITIDEEYHLIYQTDHSLKDKPFLKLDTKALDFLCKGLMAAEVAKKNGDPNVEIKSFLSMALHFSKIENSSWYWLAQELFEQCVSYDDPQNVDVSLQAIAKHLFAEFLLETQSDLQDSKRYVEESMELSADKHWRASEVTGEKGDLLYFESCLLLHKILLQMAETVKDEHVDIAIQLCRNALHWAKAVSNKNAEASALLRLVNIYLSAEILAPVLDLLDNYMKLCLELEDVNGRCEGYILKAAYYECTENDTMVVETIQELLKTADEHKILNMLAIAHRNLATFYLMQGNEKEMQEHAIHAYNCFVNLDKKNEIEAARCLTGIAQAQQMMAQYLYTVLAAEDLSSPQLNTLIDWKMLHIPFCPSTQLFHPESAINAEIKKGIESMKLEEMQQNLRTRLEEMRSTASFQNIVKYAVGRRGAPSGQESISSMSVARMNFQRLARTATGSIGSFHKFSMPKH